MEGEMRNDNNVCVKRRRVDGEGEFDQGEEIEERKVEMFYALIRSTTEARERFNKRVVISSDGHNKEKSDIEIIGIDRGLRIHRDTRPPVWIPKFEWEDFMMGTNDQRFINNGFVGNRFGPPSTHHQRLAPSRGVLGDQANSEKKDDLKGLDLRLSL
ncbi:hypothetical protein Syun_008149 [Stephania yunnanensis]|uniref:Uncharacterized protein n=1 Tax=Stephania yunnanensis TaxID=152371 RepID=A0AAP0L186_9MAGN